MIFHIFGLIASFFFGYIVLLYPDLVLRGNAGRVLGSQTNC